MRSVFSVFWMIRVPLRPKLKRLRWGTSDERANTYYPHLRYAPLNFEGDLQNAKTLYSMSSKNLAQIGEAWRVSLWHWRSWIVGSRSTILPGKSSKLIVNGQPPFLASAMQRARLDALVTAAQILSISF